VSLATVGRGPQHLAHGDIERPGEKARNEVVPIGRGLTLDDGGEQIGDLHRPLVAQRAPIAEAADVLHRQASSLALGACPVAVEEGLDLLIGIEMLSFHALVKGGERVGHGGQGRSVQAKVHIVQRAGL